MALGRPYRSRTLMRWTRNRVAATLALFALLLQTGIATANGSTLSVPDAEDAGQVAMICSTYGAMPMAEAAPDAAPTAGEQDQDAGKSATSCPVCQAHAVGKAALAAPVLAVPAPVRAEAARLDVPAAQRRDGRAVDFVTTRAPPAVV